MEHKSANRKFSRTSTPSRSEYSSANFRLKSTNSIHHNESRYKMFRPQSSYQSKLENTASKPDLQRIKKNQELMKKFEIKMKKRVKIKKRKEPVVSLCDLPKAEYLTDYTLNRKINEYENERKIEELQSRYHRLRKAKKTEVQRPTYLQSLITIHKQIISEDQL
ncbi:unnamed protein product [Moneuplotes crassus]|uniref:Uncharacterized protein n=1 Tax=Euplotes crassus TaxID=5936 RepID=A0AAD1XIC7_EUPCR|nr:unnamed protein product [Moneuplotes crassus]